jgi:outer membrane protein OmpA-like peptidoglycan-associated protein
MQNSDAPLAAEVNDRADLPRSFLNTFWPLAALALLLLMLLRACVPNAPPAAPSTTPVMAFDAADAARQANDAALEALRALPPEPGRADVLAALDGVVINFAAGSDVVPVDAAELLAAAAPVLAALPAGSRVLITGHTDNVGDAAANLVLSRRRAQAVRAALIAHGAPAAVLSAHGLGDSRPVADNGSEAGRFRNRRIEFSAAD